MDLQVFTENSSGILIKLVQICAPIIDTFRESRQPFKWTEASDKNFKLLKKKIIENPFLDLPSFDKVFQVETNASGTTIGFVLSQ